MIITTVTKVNCSLEQQLNQISSSSSFLGVFLTLIYHHFPFLFTLFDQMWVKLSETFNFKYKYLALLPSNKKSLSFVCFLWDSTLFSFAMTNHKINASCSYSMKFKPTLNHGLFLHYCLGFSNVTIQQQSSPAKMQSRCFVFVSHRLEKKQDGNWKKQLMKKITALPALRYYLPM